MRAAKPRYVWGCGRGWIGEMVGADDRCTQSSTHTADFLILTSLDAHTYTTNSSSTSRRDRPSFLLASTTSRRQTSTRALRARRPCTLSPTSRSPGGSLARPCGPSTKHQTKCKNDKIILFWTLKNEWEEGKTHKRLFCFAVPPLFFSYSCCRSPAPSLSVTFLSTNSFFAMISQPPLSSLYHPALSADMTALAAARRAW